MYDLKNVQARFNLWSCGEAATLMGNAEAKAGQAAVWELKVVRVTGIDAGIKLNQLGVAGGSHRKVSRGTAWANIQRRSQGGGAAQA